MLSIPTWAESGGWDSLLIRLRHPPPARGAARGDPESQRRKLLLGSRRRRRCPHHRTFQDSLRYMQGKTVAEIAAARHHDPIETCSTSCSRRTAIAPTPCTPSCSEPDVQAAMKQWWVAVNTDFGGVAPDGPLGTQSAHRGAYGTFPRILDTIRGPEAVPVGVRGAQDDVARRAAGRPVRSRPRAPGMYADITVFDPATVIDRATFEKPHQTSVGIEYVFVNGQMVLKRGRSRKRVRAGGSGVRDTSLDNVTLGRVGRRVVPDRQSALS